MRNIHITSRQRELNHAWEILERGVTEIQYETPVLLVSLDSRRMGQTAAYPVPWATVSAFVTELGNGHQAVTSVLLPVYRPQMHCKSVEYAEQWQCDRW